MSTTIGLTVIGSVLGLIAGTLMAGLPHLGGHLSSIAYRLGRIADALETVARNGRSQL